MTGMQLAHPSLGAAGRVRARPRVAWLGRALRAAGTALWATLVYGESGRFCPAPARVRSAGEPGAR
jgi:hypothetical protein